MAITSNSSTPAGWGIDSNTGRLAPLGGVLNAGNVSASQAAQTSQSAVGTLVKSTPTGANPVQVGTGPQAQTNQAFTWGPGVKEPARQYEMPGLESWTNEQAAQMRTGEGLSNASPDQIKQYYADRNVSSHYDEASGKWVSGSSSEAYKNAPGITVGDGFYSKTYSTDPNTVKQLVQKYKTGSLTVGDDIEAFNKMVQAGLINLDAVNGEKKATGTLSSGDARLRQAELSTQLSDMDKAVQQSFLGDNAQYKAYNEAQTVEEAQLAEQQRQQAATNAAWQIQSGRAGTTQGAAETAGMMQKFNWQLQEVQTKYNNLRRQADAEIQKGNIEAAKELRAQAQQEFTNGLALQKDARDAAQFELDKKAKQDTALEKAEKNVETTAKRWVEAGIVPDDDTFYATDKKLGVDPGTSKLSYLATQSNFQRDQLKDNLANAKSSAELAKLNNDLKMMTFENMKTITETLDKMPPGTMVSDADGNTYFSTNLGHIETDNNGMVTGSYVDPETGNVVIRQIGNIGKADKASMETVYVNGVPIIRNKNTKASVIQTIPNAPGPAGDMGLDAYFPQGSTLPSKYDNLECGEFQHSLSDSYPYGLNTAEEKAAAVTIQKEKGPQPGYQIFHNVSGKSAKYGHVAMVNWVGEDESGRTIMKVTEANYAKPGMITHDRVMYADDPSIMGYRNDPLRPEFQKILQTDVDTPEPQGEATPAGLKISSASPFVTGTQSESQYQAAMQKEEAARIMADQIMSDDLVVDPKKFDPIQTRALQIAKENGFITADKADKFEPEDYNSFKQRKIESGGAVGPFGLAGLKPTETSLRAEYDMRNEAFKQMQVALASRAGGVTPQRLKTLQKNLNDAIKEGDMFSAQDRLMTSIPTTMGKVEEQKFNGTKNILEQLDKLSVKLNEYIQAGGTTDIFSGTVENLAAKVGEIEDPVRRSLAAQISTALIDYRQSVTGAAFTVSEARMYDKLFPGISKDPALNKALIEGLKEGFVSKRNGQIKNAIGAKPFDAIFGEVKVRDKKNGVVGTMPKLEYDANLYEIVK